MVKYKRKTMLNSGRKTKEAYDTCDARIRRDAMRERLRQKLKKAISYKIKYDLYKNGMITKISI
jgi:hypothetical protein